LVAQAIERSVVFISTRSMNSDEAARAVPEAAGQGSGVIIDETGYILTNFHVVLGASHIVVHLADGRTELADVVGVDEYSDLAVLKIDAEDLMAAKWGNSDDLEPGDPVWAIGSPYGLDNSVTFGIVSAKGRNGIGATRYQDLLQTDAAVNPGNSGGALVSAKGELVGINTAIMGSAFRGISFAIPSNMAREVFDRLQADGEVPRGWLGVRLDRLSPAAAKSAGIEEGRGVVIIEVLGGSPALAAGLKPDDIVVKWQGQPVEDPRRFSFLVAETEPATVAEIEVIRDGVALALEVEVGRLPRRVR
jgi:serine protease Do